MKWLMVWILRQRSLVKRKRIEREQGWKEVKKEKWVKVKEMVSKEDVVGDEEQISNVRF